MLLRLGQSTSSPPSSTRPTMILLTILLSCLAWVEGTNRPIVGILAQEVPGHEEARSSISASYVKAVEASGARVVPIFINRPEKYYRRILSVINGVVFPGGSVDLHHQGGFADAAEIIYSIALELNSQGDHFPILGICQGLETLAFLANNRSDILTNCNCDNVDLPLNFKPDFMNSQLYRNATDENIYFLSHYPVTSNHHHLCLTEKNLTKTGLASSWHVLSTNKDVAGIEFISSMEMYNFPIVGVQFHPEKNPFEWRSDQNNPHSFKAIKSSRLFYDWLVSQARRSNHTFPNKVLEYDTLIYNYNPIYTGKEDLYNLQVYYFPIDPFSKYKVINPATV